MQRLQCSYWNLLEIETPRGQRARRSSCTRPTRAGAVLIALQPGQELGEHQVQGARVPASWSTARSAVARGRASRSRPAPGRCFLFEPDERHEVIDAATARGSCSMLAPWPGPGHYGRAAGALPAAAADAPGPSPSGRCSRPVSGSSSSWRGAGRTWTTGPLEVLAVLDAVHQVDERDEQHGVEQGRDERVGDRPVLVPTKFRTRNMNDREERGPLPDAVPRRRLHLAHRRRASGLRGPADPSRRTCLALALRFVLLALLRGARPSRSAAPRPSSSTRTSSYSCRCLLLGACAAFREAI